MTKDYDLPRDLYFWGQDRYGSVTPLFAQPMVMLGMDSIWAASLTQYFILALGFLISCTFVSKSYFKVLLALVWFLPPTRFMDHIGFYSGISYSFIFLAFYFLQKVLQESKKAIIWSVLYSLIGGFSLVVAIWISDVAIISTFVLLFLFAYQIIRFFKGKLKFRMAAVFLLLILIGIFGFQFISFAKEGSVVRNSYSQLANFDTFSKSLFIWLDSIWKLLLFQGKEFFTSIYIWLLIPVVIWIVKDFRRHLNYFMRYPLFVFLVMEGMFVMGAILTSEWSFQNNVPRRYLACTYLTMSFLGIIVFEKVCSNSPKIILHKAYLGLTILIGGLGGIYHLNTVWPGTLHSRFDYSKEISSLGNVAIISNYWNGYVNMLGDDNEVLAIPWMWEENRERTLIDKAFEREEIYILRDMWLTDYPDTLEVHKRVLIKNGQDFELANSNLCLYKLLLRK